MKTALRDREDFLAAGIASNTCKGKSSRDEWDFPSTSGAVISGRSLTIGFFDGVHIGHQGLLKRLRELPHATILTFSNHPQCIIKPPAPELLIPYEERITLLREYADELIILPFTSEFAAIRYDELLDQFDLSHILLGAGSVFGKNREGNEENVRKYGAKKGIVVEYIPKLLFEKEPVSSSRIREAKATGQITLAQKLLGRSL